jgi:hypothetical protein
VTEPGHEQWEFVVFVAFHDAGADPAMLARDDVCLVEQHCLAHTAEAVEYEAACVLAGAEALEGDSEVVELSVASREQRWSCSGAGGVRVLVAIHLRRSKRLFRSFQTDRRVVLQGS